MSDLVLSAPTDGGCLAACGSVLWTAPGAETRFSRPSFMFKV